MQHKPVLLDPFLDDFEAQNDDPSLSPDASRRLNQKLQEFRGLPATGFLESELTGLNLFD